MIPYIERGNILVNINYPGIRIIPLPRPLRSSRRADKRVEVRATSCLRMENYPWRRKNQKLANGMNMWKENGNTTTLLFSLKGLGILYQERRGQGKTIVMNTLTGSSSTSPGLLTSSILITHHT